MISKKKAMLAGLMLAVVSMMAYAAERGVATDTGTGADRATACAAAKNRAHYKATSYHPQGGGPLATVTGYSACECSANNSSWWTCTVDAYWEKK